VIIEADCIAAMADMEADSIDAIATDPPYELGFMGKAWDSTGIAFDPATWSAMLRVAKPGAYLLAFGGTRTFHRMMVAIEDAGWELRDTLCWAYAQGFPKSRNISKDIDRLQGAQREVVGTMRAPGMASTNVEQGDQGRSKLDFDVLSDVAITSDAQKWQGWGTALKPAWEPIVMARKPHPGSIAANVLRSGTGALNIEGARVGDRWPANLLLTDPVLRGDYSRMFLVPKAGPDREPILSDREAQPVASTGSSKVTAVNWGDADQKVYERKTMRQNTHPACKPVDLMRHLVRLVTPRDGVVLDPFLGSGTTGVAAELEGYRWIGIEREHEYVLIAEDRLHWLQRGLAL
jgi:site-specific DNA-methyltransferase (adenine-specific)